MNHELTFKEFCELPLTYTSGMTGDWGAHRMYRNADVGLQKEIVTQRAHHGDIYGGWKDSKVYYFLDGDPNTYKTIDQVYVAYMEKVCGVEA